MFTENLLWARACAKLERGERGKTVDIGYRDGKDVTTTHENSLSRDLDTYMNKSPYNKIRGEF